MNLLRNLIRPYLYARYGFSRLTGTGSFGHRRFTPVTSGIDPGWNPLKQALWSHHVKQFHESSCSVASVAGCLNALRSQTNGHLGPIDQHALLERVTTGNWKARMSDGGYRGRRGLPLDLLGRVVAASLTAYELQEYTVTVCQASNYRSQAAGIRTLLKERLATFDADGTGLIIAHFDQGSLAPTLNIPHISPVGGYDPHTEQVTMLDVDPEQPQPYQVDFDTFYQALATNYHNVFRAYGYGSGGYVHIART